MSTDFELRTMDKDFNSISLLEAIKADEYIPLHEVVFLDKPISSGKWLCLFAIRRDAEIKRAYIQQFGNKGYYFGKIGRLFNFPIRKKAINFAKKILDENDEEEIPLVLVSAHTSIKQELKDLYLALKSIAKKFDLLLYDPQVDEYIDINDLSELPKYYIDNN